MRSKNKLFLTNKALESFIAKIRFSKERKDFLLSKIPQMDREERLKLFETLTKIFLLDLEEKRAIKRIKKYWKK